MNEPINMTPQELVMWLFAGVIAISVALEKLSKGARIIYDLIKRAKQPEESQNEQISANAEKLQKHDTYFENDNRRLNEIEAWVTTNDRIIREHDRKIANQKDATESLRKYMEIQMNALLAMLQSLGKLSPGKDIDDATKEILSFLSHEKLGGKNE